MHLSLKTNPDIPKPVIILGAGGHAKVLIEALHRSGREIIGITDPTKAVGSEYFGVNVIGNDDSLFEFSQDEVLLVNGIGTIPGKNLRWELTARMEDNGYRFTEVIHPSAVIAGDVGLENGVQIMAGVVIQSGTRIGRSCIINTGVIIDHDCDINDECHLAPGVTLSGSVYVGKGTHIGTGSIVIQNVTIGKGCIIAAGSIIHKDIANNITYIQPRMSG